MTLNLNHPGASSNNFEGPFTNQEIQTQNQLQGKLQNLYVPNYTASDLMSLNQDELMQILQTQKQRYDVHRQQCMMFASKQKDLNQQEKTLKKQHLNKCAELDRDSTSAKYQMLMTKMKCNISRILNKQKCDRVVNLQRAFLKFKTNAKCSALRTNYKSHSLQMNVSKKVVERLSQHMNKISKGSLRFSFTKWKQQILIRYDLQEINHQMSSHLQNLSKQLDTKQKEIRVLQSTKDESDQHLLQVQTKMKQLQNLQSELQNNIQKYQNQSTKKDASQLANDYAERVKRERLSQQQISGRSSRQQDIQKKEVQKQRLTEQLKNLQRQNSQLKEKLEETEGSVQGFLEEMGSLIDSASAQCDLGPSLPPNRQNNPNVSQSQQLTGNAPPRGPANSQRPGVMQSTHINPSNMQRQQYVGGGSGESTGGSARHYL